MKRFKLSVQQDDTAYPPIEFYLHPDGTVWAETESGPLVLTINELVESYANALRGLLVQEVVVSVKVSTPSRQDADG